MLTIINQPYLVNWSNNPIVFKLQTDIDPTTLGLYIECKLAYRLLAQPATTPIHTELTTFAITPDSTGIMQCDVAKLLNSVLNYQVPNLATNYEQIKTQVAEYKITFTEKIGITSADVKEFTQTVYKGGLAFEKWVGLTYFTTLNYPQRNFLSWLPNERVIGTTEDVWLTYTTFEALNTGPLTANIDLFFTDGSTNGDVVIHNLKTDPEKYDMFRFRVGAIELDLASSTPTGTMIDYIRVQIRINNIALAEYILQYDHTIDYRQRVLHYFNSLGGFDSVRLLGDTDGTAEYVRQVAQQYLQQDYLQKNELSAEEFTQHISEKITYKSNVGNVEDKSIADVIRELMLSKKVLTKNYNRWWPIQIATKSLPIGEDLQFLHNNVIEWQYSFSNQNYTPESIDTGNFPSCPIPNPLQKVTNGDGSFTLSYGTNALHISYEIRILGAWKESRYTNSNTYTLEDMYAGTPVYVVANCGFAYSAVTNTIIL